MLLSSKVLDGLRDAPAPDPVSVSAQYVKAMADAVEDAEDEEKPPAPAPARTARRSLAALLSQKAPETSAESATEGPGPSKRKAPSDKHVDVGDSEHAYKPQHFQQKRQIFVASAMADGMSYNEARSAWTGSVERARLLASVPLGELKRRRFVPKGATCNPFLAVAAGGG